MQDYFVGEKRKVLHSCVGMLMIPIGKLLQRATEELVAPAVQRRRPGTLDGSPRAPEHV